MEIGAGVDSVAGQAVITREQEGTGDYLGFKIRFRWIWCGWHSILQEFISCLFFIGLYVLHGFNHSDHFEERVY